MGVTWASSARASPIVRAKPHGVHAGRWAMLNTLVRAFRSLSLFHFRLTHTYTTPHTLTFSTFDFFCIASVSRHPETHTCVALRWPRPGHTQRSDGRDPHSRYRYRCVETDTPSLPHRGKRPRPALPNAAPPDRSSSPPRPDDEPLLLLYRSPHNKIEVKGWEDHARETPARRLL